MGLATHPRSLLGYRNDLVVAGDLEDDRIWKTTGSGRRQGLFDLAGSRE